MLSLLNILNQVAYILNKINHIFLYANRSEAKTFPTIIFNSMQKMGCTMSGGPHGTNRPEQSEDRTMSGGHQFCADRSEAETFPTIIPNSMQKMGCTMSGGHRFCTDRSEAETLNPWGQGTPLQEQKRPSKWMIFLFLQKMGLEPTRVLPH